MLAFVSSGPQIHWMQAQPGDPAGLAFILLASLALVAFFVVRRISRNQGSFVAT
jgi:hypothetical protein